MRNMVLAGIASALMFTATAAGATGCPGDNKFAWENTKVAAAEAALTAAQAAGKAYTYRYVGRTEALCYVAISTTCAAPYDQGSLGFLMQSFARYPLGAATGGCVARVHYTDGTVVASAIYPNSAWTLVRR